MSGDLYGKAEYLLSAHKLDQLPGDTGHEVAFVGRSNVGKSTVINALTGKKGLAHTSKFPGRTQQLNYFVINRDIRLVDLPGYGYAKVPQSVKDHWFHLINGYFHIRDSLAGLVLIVDIRRQITEQELAIMDWCYMAKIPIHLLVNKADKLAFGARKQALERFRKQSAGRCGSIQLFSSTKKTGIEELKAILDDWLFSPAREDEVKVGPGLVKGKI